MDKKSKVFFWVMGILIIASIGVTYWRIMIKNDYVVEASVDCDPYSEVCFVWECDPESDVDGEACTGDPEADIWYFKVASRNASRIPLCNPDEDEDCMPFVCDEGEEECGELLCSEDIMEDYYATSCNDPVVFTEENPMEEEEDATCEDPSGAETGGDEECLSAEESVEEPVGDKAVEEVTEEEVIGGAVTTTEEEPATESEVQE